MRIRINYRSDKKIESASESEWGSEVEVDGIRLVLISMDMLWVAIWLGWHVDGGGLGSGLCEI